MAKALWTYGGLLLVGAVIGGVDRIAFGVSAEMATLHSIWGGMGYMLIVLLPDEPK